MIFIIGKQSLGQHYTNNKWIILYVFKVKDHKIDVLQINIAVFIHANGLLGAILKVLSHTCILCRQWVTRYCDKCEQVGIIVRFWIGLSRHYFEISPEQMDRNLAVLKKGSFCNMHIFNDNTFINIGFYNVLYHN